MRVEVDVEDGVIPPGKEIVRIGWPKDGEHVVNATSSGGVVVADGDFCRKSWAPRVIVRDKWEWPAHLIAGWIAMDKDGSWYAFNLHEPFLHSDQDYYTCWLRGVNGTRDLIPRKLFAFNPPPCTDWRQSLHRNPNAKGTP